MIGVSYKRCCDVLSICCSVAEIMLILCDGNKNVRLRHRYFWQNLIKIDKKRVLRGGGTLNILLAIRRIQTGNWRNPRQRLKKMYNLTKNELVALGFTGLRGSLVEIMKYELIIITLFLGHKSCLRSPLRVNNNR